MSTLFSEEQRTKRVSNNVDVLKDYGFMDDQIDAIVEKNAGIFTLNNLGGTFFSRLKNLENYGFSKEEIISIVNKLPPTLSYAEDSINSKLKNLEKRRTMLAGKLVAEWNKEEVKSNVCRLSVLLGYNEESLDRKFKVRMLIAHACNAEPFDNFRRLS